MIGLSGGASINPRRRGSSASTRPISTRFSNGGAPSGSPRRSPSRTRPGSRPRRGYWQPENDQHTAAPMDIKPPTLDELHAWAEHVFETARNESRELAILTLSNALLVAWTEGAMHVVNVEAQRIAALLIESFPDEERTH